MTHYITIGLGIATEWSKNVGLSRCSCGMDFRGDNCHTLAQKHAKLANRQERRQQRRDNRHRYERLREAHKANKLFLKAIVDIIGTEFRSDEQKCKDIELLLITEGFWDGVKKLTLSLD